MEYGERIVHLINAKFAEKAEDEFRTHLGASVLGDKCMRAVWFGWKWADKELFDGRMLRLFYRGQNEEKIFVELLENLGATVWTEDANGKQFRVSTLGGHVGGSMDGVAIGLPELPTTPVLLEMKTHNDKSFKLLLSQGLEKTKPKHYKQAQVYMHLADLKFCLYCAVNKNDDHLWFYFFARDQTGAMMAKRGETIIFGHGIPPRISESPSWYECRFCTFNGVCFGRKMPLVNCRTCAFSKPLREGGWSCGLGQSEIVSSPKVGCDHHAFDPLLFPHLRSRIFSETVEYERKNGTRVVNGRGHTSSQDLDLT